MIERRFIFMCDVCKRTAEISERIGTNDGNRLVDYQYWLPSVRIPDGWKSVGGLLLLCERHSIAVDGEEYWKAVQE